MPKKKRAKKRRGRKTSLKRTKRAKKKTGFVLVFGSKKNPKKGRTVFKKKNDLPIGFTKA